MIFYASTTLTLCTEKLHRIHAPVGKAPPKNMLNNSSADISPKINITCTLHSITWLWFCLNMLDHTANIASTFYVYNYKTLTVCLTSLTKFILTIKIWREKPNKTQSIAFLYTRGQKFDTCAVMSMTSLVSWRNIYNRGHIQLRSNMTPNKLLTLGECSL